MSKRKISRIMISFALIMILVLSSAVGAFACTGIYFGKDVTENGSTIAGRSEDAGWTTYKKYYTVREAETHTPGAMYDGYSNFTCPLPEETLRYTLVKDYTGEGKEEMAQVGTNEKGVACSSSVTLSGGLAAVINTTTGVDPMVSGANGGLREEDVPTVVLMQAETAREGAQILVDIYSDTGAGTRDGTWISDPDETWFVQSVSGHNAVAVKAPDDMVGFTPNMTGNVDLSDKDNVITSPNLFKTANQAGTVKVDDEGRILVANSYASSYSSVNNRLWQGYYYLNGQEYADATVTGTCINTFIEPERDDYTLYEAMRLLAYRGEGTERYGGTTTGNSGGIGNDNTLEAHIFETRQNMPDELAVLQWLSLTPPEFNMYLPGYNALITDTYAENKTNITTMTYDNADPDNNSYRTVFYELYFLCKGRDSTMTTGALEARTKYGQGVKAFWEAYQKELIAKQPAIDQEMRKILAYDYDLACEKATALMEHLQTEALYYAKQMVAELKAFTVDDGGAAVYTPTALTEGKLPTYTFDAIGGTGLEPGGSDDFKYPTFLSETYGPLDDPDDADNVVMVINNEDGSQTIIPRSGYYGNDRAGGMVYDTGMQYSYELMEAAKFTDVPDWAKDAVNFTFVRGVVKGVSETKFNSNANITRQDFVTMLMRAMNADSVTLPTPDTKFADDASISDYAKKYVNGAKALGIATGSDNKFNPKATITRQEMFTFIYRAMDAFGILPENIDPKSPAASAAFSDYNQVSAYAKDPIDALYNLDLVSGSGGKLTPKANTTRAQSAQIIANVLQFEISNF